MTFMTSSLNACVDLTPDAMSRYSADSPSMNKYILIGLSSMLIGSSAMNTMRLVAGSAAFDS